MVVFILWGVYEINNKIRFTRLKKNYTLLVNTVFNILAETFTQGNKRFMNSLYITALFTVVNLLGIGICQKFFTWVTTLEKYLHIFTRCIRIFTELVCHEENKKQSKGPPIRNNKINVIYLYSKLLGSRMMKAFVTNLES